MAVRFAIVAGEVSGDRLGAGLMRALRRRFAGAEFFGVGGEQMRALGCQSLVPLERLAVMGLAEVLRHLPELVATRRRLLREISDLGPVAFIGIDAPDFNLGLERKLRSRGIPTVHYVSPQVWAWRRWRVRGIGRSVDLMLTLFPFEASFYRKHGIEVRFVGHPLADEVPLATDRQAARATIEAPSHAPMVALLPGSRRMEVEAMAPAFADTVRWLHRHCPQLAAVAAAATPALANRLRSLFEHHGVVVEVLEGRAREAMAAADVVLLASGTATLESLLLKRPMVVAYKVSPATAWLARRLVKVPHFALPNLLAGSSLVPEFFQEDVSAAQLGPAVLDLLENPSRQASLVTAFDTIHRQLRRGASESAADAIADLLAA